MGLSVDTIITLDNNEEPIKDDVKIFLEIVEGLDTYVETITDQTLIINLTKKFKES